MVTFVILLMNFANSLDPDQDRHQASKYLKIGTCPASQKLLAYMGKT